MIARRLVSHQLNQTSKTALGHKLSVLKRRQRSLEFALVVMLKYSVNLSEIRHVIDKLTLSLTNILAKKSIV